MENISGTCAVCNDPFHTVYDMRTLCDYCELEKTGPWPTIFYFNCDCCDKEFQTTNNWADLCRACRDLEDLEDVQYPDNTPDLMDDQNIFNER